MMEEAYSQKMKPFCPQAFTSYGHTSNRMMALSMLDDDEDAKLAKEV
jgi:hypothetical protein